MREEIREIKDTIRIYIAEDGTEFTEKWACEKYELNLKNEEIEKKFKKIGYLYNKPSVVDNASEYRWFKVLNIEDLKTIKYYYDMVGYNSLDIDEEEFVNFPTIIGIEEGFGSDAWYIGTLEEFKEQLQEALVSVESLENEFNVNL